MNRETVSQTQGPHLTGAPVTDAGKPTGMIMDEYSDEYAFAAAAMRAPWVLTPPPAQAPVTRRVGALRHAAPAPSAHLQAAASTG